MMKKSSVKRLLALVLVLALVLSVMAVTVLADDENKITVMYDGSIKNADKSTGAVVLNGSSPIDKLVSLLTGEHDHPVDLFSEKFKNMMPGDTAEEIITVGATNCGGDTVRIYLRPEKTEVRDSDGNIDLDTDYATLQEHSDWITFTVTIPGAKESGPPQELHVTEPGENTENLAVDGNGAVTLAEGDFSNGVLLGTFKNGQRIDLEVTLYIDKEAGNELQGLTAGVDWVFTAEVEPYIPPVSPPSPDLLTDQHYNYIVGYPDGSVRPNGSITRAEVVTIFFRLLTDEAREASWTTSNPYPDVDGKDWFNVAVSTMTTAGIVEGYEDGTFRPNAAITRAELAAIVSRFDETFGTFTPESDFPDITGHWAETYIRHAADRGWVVGYPDGTFRPAQSITRAETVTMINRVLERGVDKEGLTGAYVDWFDNYSNSWYHFDMIEAGNYHDFEYSDRPMEDRSINSEDWIELLDPIDWSGMEQEWVRTYG